MGRNIILCADGTCNAFGGKHSNVATLVELITLKKPANQIAIYDQGIGTKTCEFDRIVAWKDKQLQDRELHESAFYLLPPPDYGRFQFMPAAFYKRLKAMIFGDGLEDNVKQLYVKLAELYEPSDTLFFFGFSRGAFTVRALAGLLWRYGLPAYKDLDRAEKLFDCAWNLFRNEFPDEKGENRNKAIKFQDEYHTRKCQIDFLGLWDTVKSYGGYKPVTLPHLRHNPSIKCVRHALALDEERGWFDVTQWGWLDSDRKNGNAASRLDPADRNIIASRKNVKEVWFVGAHSDIGGDCDNRETSDIALRWMLGEARTKGLLLNNSGMCFLSTPVQMEHPTVQTSRSLGWKLIDLIPRYAIDNSGKWPVLREGICGPAKRNPLAHTRDGVVFMHESVPIDRRPLSVRHCKINIYPTLRLKGRHIWRECMPIKLRSIYYKYCGWKSSLERICRK